MERFSLLNRLDCDQIGLYGLRFDLRQRGFLWTKKCMNIDMAEFLWFLWFLGFAWE